MVAIIALCVSALAVGIALLSWITNQEKLRLDLSARRYKVYDELRKTARKISDVGDDSSVMGDLYQDLEAVRMEASFLFKPEIENDIEAIVKTGSEIIQHIERKDVWIEQLYLNEKFRLTSAVWFQTLLLSKKIEASIDFRDVAAKRVSLVLMAKSARDAYLAFVERARRGE